MVGMFPPWPRVPIRPSQKRKQAPRLCHARREARVEIEVAGCCLSPARAPAGQARGPAWPPARAPSLFFWGP